jgi:hypothetical protein
MREKRLKVKAGSYLSSSSAFSTANFNNSSEPPFRQLNVEVFATRL